MLFMLNSFLDNDKVLKAWKTNTYQCRKPGWGIGEGTYQPLLILLQLSATCPILGKEFTKVLLLLLNTIIFYKIIITLPKLCEAVF